MRNRLLIFFIFISLGSYAHQDMIFSVNKGNVHVKYLSGWQQFEIGYKVNILLELTDKLVRTKGYTSDNIYIYFEHDYTKSQKPYLALGYGDFSYMNYEEDKPSINVKKTGIKIIIRDRDLDTKKILTLINSALDNVTYINKNQKQLIIDLNLSINGVDQYDTLISISANKVNKYQSSTDTTINRLLNEKIYRNLKKTNKNRAIDYYFQNDQFHFYNTREHDKEWSQETREYVETKTYGEDILIVDNVHEIFGSFNDGHFIFTNDSVFYYIPQLKDKVSGPFKVDSVKVGRRPILKYYHEYSPVNRFTLFVDNYQNYNKAIFFPDSNLVISNFDKIENDFINNLLKAQTNNNEPNKTDSKLIIILIFFALSIATNIWLSLKKRK